MSFYLSFKRLADFLFALLLVIFLSPFLLLVAVIARFSTGSPVLFRQRRPGLYGKPFEMVKFRTMSNARDGSGALLPDSQRLTPFGRWLRSTSIDELPALINILRGEMSFIGPRPLLMQYLPLYSPEQARRHDVRPGFSGWSQVNGRNSISWDEKLEHDIWYVDNCNIFLDLRILFRTVFDVILRRGITTNEGCLMPVFKGSSSPRSPHD